jgi:hypothetical protein
MDEAQWDVFLQRLLDASRAAIRRFAAEHPAGELCYFAFDSEPRYGYVLTCFNTSRANLQHVREWHDKRVAYRKELLSQSVWRDHAYYQVKANSVSPFCNNTGDFAYQDFAEVKFPEWQAFAESNDYPEASNDNDDYLQNRVALIFARALDTLAEEGSFSGLRLSSPTMLGFGFHDQDQLIVRMLNLPTPGGSGVA